MLGTLGNRRSSRAVQPLPPPQLGRRAGSCLPWARHLAACSMGSSQHSRWGSSSWGTSQNSQPGRRATWSLWSGMLPCSSSFWRCPAAWRTCWPRAAAASGASPPPPLPLLLLLMLLLLLLLMLLLPLPRAQQQQNPCAFKLHVTAAACPQPQLKCAAHTPGLTHRGAAPPCPYAPSPHVNQPTRAAAPQWWLQAAHFQDGQPSPPRGCATERRRRWATSWPGGAA